MTALVATGGLSLVGLVGACASLPEVQRAQRAALAEARLNGRALAERSRAVAARYAPAGSRRDFLAEHLAVEEAVAATPLVAGNQVTLLEDGPATYAAIFDSLREARDHIHLLTYILEDDAVGRRLAELLIERRRAGVRVAILADGIGSIGVGTGFVAELRNEGIDVLFYNPVNPLATRGAGWSINQRNHRKILIVDGRIAFTGGINVSGVYSEAPGGSTGLRGRRNPLAGDPTQERKEPPWRDTHVRIAGPVAADFQRIFLDDWQAQNGPPIARADWFPPIAPAGALTVRAVASGGERDPGAIYLTFLSAIASAGRSIYITMGYFVPDDETLRALKDAARRGVDVQLVLPSFSDFWVVLEAGRATYDELLAAGVRIFERGGALLHAKTVVIDGVWSTVGSSNLDWRSFLHNKEVNAVILGASFGAELEAMFRRDLAASTEITLAAWRERGLWRRVKEGFAGWWGYWL